jgi:hypothetical protein
VEATQTRETGDLIRLLSFFESRLKIELTAKGLKSEQLLKDNPGACSRVNNCIRRGLIIAKLLVRRQVCSL